MAKISLGEQQAFLGDIFLWWYSQGLKDFFLYLKAILAKLADFFSVKLLFKTYFSPWKRDVVPMEGLALEEMLKVLAFNLMARMIGAFIKTIIFFIFLIFLFAFLALAIFLLVIWIFLPVLSVGLVITGVMLIFNS